MAGCLSFLQTKVACLRGLLKRSDHLTSMSDGVQWLLKVSGNGKDKNDKRSE